MHATRCSPRSALYPMHVVGRDYVWKDGPMCCCRGDKGGCFFWLEFLAIYMDLLDDFCFLGYLRKGI